MIRKNLIKYRGKRSQKEMAEQYNVTQQCWYGWEKGLYTPKIYLIKKLEKDSGISMEKLFPDIFNKNKL